MERMRRLRDECNQTPSPLRPKPRPTKLAATMVEGSPTVRRIQVKQKQLSPKCSKQSTPKQLGKKPIAAKQSTIKSTEKSTEIQEQSDCAVASMTPRMSKPYLKTYASRHSPVSVATKPQPHLLNLNSSTNITTALMPWCSGIESNIPPTIKEIANEEGLPPMYFTMKYKDNRDSGTAAQATGDCCSPTCPNEDYGLKPRQGLTSLQQEHDCNYDDHLKISNINVTEENKLRIEDETSVVNNNNSPKHQGWAHVRVSKGSQAYIPCQKSSAPPRTQHSQAFSSPINTSPKKFQMKEKAKTYSHLRTPLSKHTPTFEGTTTTKVLDKMENRPRVVLAGLGFRSFSWGNGLLGANRKENLLKSDLVGIQANKQNAKTMGAVYEKVRNFEALTSGVTKQGKNATNQELIGRSRLQNRNVVPEAGTRRKNRCHNPASSVRQYLGARSKGELPDVNKNTPPCNPRCENKGMTESRERSSKNCTPKTPKYRRSLDKVRLRVSGTTQFLKSPTEVSNATERSNKQKNPEDGRFPPWSGSTKPNIMSTGVHSSDSTQGRGLFTPVPTWHLEQPQRNVSAFFVVCIYQTKITLSHTLLINRYLRLAHGRYLGPGQFPCRSCNITGVVA